MKIAINPTYGGFRLNYKEVMRYAELKGIKLYAALDKFGPRGGRKLRTYNGEPLNNWWDESFVCYFTKPIPKSGKWTISISKSLFPIRDIARNDPFLIQAVEEAGNEASVKIVEIPDDVEWVIEEYDGAEWVSEKHRIWD